MVDAKMEASYKRWRQDFPFKNKPWSKFWDFGDWPVNWLSFGGRGSTVYTGPPGAAAFLEHYGPQAGPGLERVLAGFARNAPDPVRLKPR
jgi:hypothetical protein